MLSRAAAPPSSRATRSVARSEARKRRASGRRCVGSCNELAGARETEDLPEFTLRTVQVQIRGIAEVVASFEYVFCDFGWKMMTRTFVVAQDRSHFFNFMVNLLEDLYGLRDVSMQF